MNLRDVAALRMRNQRVWGAHFESAAEVVGWLGCVQSQEYQVAKWSLAQRASGFADADVDSLLAQGRILRTHILRPTWHFVLPADIRWMMRLTGPRVAKYIRPSVDIRVPSEAVIQRALDVIRAALSGGQRMTRKQLVEVLVRDGLPPDPREIMPIEALSRRGHRAGPNSSTRWSWIRSSPAGGAVRRRGPVTWSRLGWPGS